MLRRALLLQTDGMSEFIEMSVVIEHNQSL